MGSSACCEGAGCENSLTSLAKLCLKCDHDSLDMETSTERPELLLRGRGPSLVPEEVIGGCLPEQNRHRCLCLVDLDGRPVAGVWSGVPWWQIRGCESEVLGPKPRSWLCHCLLFDLGQVPSCP